MSNKKEKLTLDSLLTWDDIISLGDPNGKAECCVSKNVLKECCLDKDAKRELKNNFKEYIYDKFRSRFPESNIPIEILDIRFTLTKNKEGKWEIKYSIPHFISSFYSYLANDDATIVHKEFLALLFASEDYDGVDAAVKSVFEGVNDEYNKLIRDLNNKAYELNIPATSLSDDIMKNKRMIRWCLNNLEKLLEFLNEPFPTEVLEPVNKDRFMLYSTAFITSDPTIKKVLTGTYDLKEFTKYIDNDNIISLLNYANNYRLMIEYLNSENNNDYYIEMRINGDSVNSTEVIETFEEINEPLRSDNELSSKIGYFNSYQEFLENSVKEALNRMNNKKIITKIKVKFNMLLSGTFNLDKNNYGGKPRTEKGQAELKKQYDLMHDKIEYYTSKEPVVELVGIDNFVGYFAQFYENGCVVLDKLCRYSKNRKGEQVILPSKNDGIYIMNHKEFANFCALTKPELIEEKSKSNPDIDRKNHSEGWQRRIDEVIAGPGYGGIDLDFINRLVEELAIEEYNSEEVIKKLKK